MGIRFSCPNGHKLNVKENLAGKRGICPACGAKFVIPSAGEAGPVTGSQAGGASATAQSAAASAAAAPSVVIALADAPPAPAPPIAPALAVRASAPGPPETKSPAATPIVANEAPLFITNPDNPVAAVSKYTARRMRSRRLQTTIAIVLLIAVLVLGIVLVWVLSRGTETAGRSEHPNRAQVASTNSLSNPMDGLNIA
ncbi:MAG TPA: hypothetical protein VHK01_18050 [Lacipirellulaceae bacterium]|jgi:hypothetical protein|nr:hypothetical protein [Lacipirellulaceae bacterium]